jgi:MFS family permease
MGFMQAGSAGNFTGLETIKETEKSWEQLLMMIGVIFIFGLIAFILSVLGFIYMFLGRKEFGKKHEKFVKYGFIFLILAIILNFSADFLASNIKTGIGVFSSFFAVLMSFCFLYNLENRNGKIMLYLMLILTITMNIVFSSLAMLMSPASFLKTFFSPFVLAVLMIPSIPLIIAYIIPILRINKSELIVETVCLPEPFSEQKQ